MGQNSISWFLLFVEFFVGDSGAGEGSQEELILCNQVFLKHFNLLLYSVSFLRFLHVHPKLVKTNKTSRMLSCGLLDTFS